MIQAERASRRLGTAAATASSPPRPPLPGKTDRPNNSVDYGGDRNHLRLGLVTEHLKEELRVGGEIQRLRANGEHLVGIALRLIAARETSG